MICPAWPFTPCERTFPSPVLPSPQRGSRSSQRCSLPSAPSVIRAERQSQGRERAHEQNRVPRGVLRPSLVASAVELQVQHGQPDKGSHLHTSSLAVYLLPNTNSPQTNIRGKSLVFSMTDRKSWDQRASGNS